MTSSKKLALVLPLAGLVTWQCGGGGFYEGRLDAGKDLVIQSGRDGGLLPASDAFPGVGDVADAVPDTGSDRRLAPESARDAVPPGTSDGARDLGSAGKSDVLVDTKPDGVADTDPDVADHPPDVRRDVGFADSGEGRCHDLVAAGPTHEIVNIAGPAPAPLGGIIEDGLYYETAAQIFDAKEPEGPTGERRRMTMLIEGEILQGVFTQSPADEEVAETDRMIVDDPDAGTAAFTIKKLCPPEPAFGDLVFHYSFVGSGPGATFTIIYPQDITSSLGTIVLTLTRQK